MEMAYEGKVVQMGARFKSEKNGETVERNGLALHLGIECQGSLR